MEETIRKYVEYHFRNKKGEEKETLIEEVTNNLLERYEELKETYGDEDRAYRETIARMGDFTDVDREFNPVFTEIPKLYDVGLLVGVVLSVFGLVAIFLHESLAFILTVISIVMFVASAYYTYHKAQYEKTVNGDIDRFHLYLDKSFSYLKTAFIFWGITFTILLGEMIAATILFIEGVNNPMSAITNIQDFIGLYFFSFLIASIIIGVFFYKLYQRIMMYYYHLSGKDHLDGTFKKGLSMLKGDDLSISKVFEKSLPWFALIFLFIGSISPIELDVSYRHTRHAPAFMMMFDMIAPRYYFTGILLLIAKIALIIVIIKSIRHSEFPKKWLSFSVLGVLSAYVIVYLILFQDTTHFVSPVNMVTLMFAYLVIVLVAAVVSKLNKRQDKGSV